MKEEFPISAKHKHALIHHYPSSLLYIERLNEVFGLVCGNRFVAVTDVGSDQLDVLIHAR